jgi:hypothetical protein
MPGEGEHSPSAQHETLSVEPSAAAPPKVTETAENAPAVTTEPAETTRTTATSNEPVPSAQIEEIADEETPTETRRRSTRQRKPSEIARRLLSGEGTTGGRGAARIPASILEFPQAIVAEVQGEPGEPFLPIFALAAMAGDEPTYAQAMKGPDSEIWRTSMSSEINDITTRDTYELVPPPSPGTNIVGNTWVLKRKRNAQNEIVKHKSRLCAQGFSQKPGIDYHNTAAPTVRTSSLRYVLTLAAAHDSHSAHSTALQRCTAITKAQSSSRSQAASAHARNTSTSSTDTLRRPLRTAASASNMFRHPRWLPTCSRRRFVATSWSISDTSLVSVRLEGEC